MENFENIIWENLEQTEKQDDLKQILEQNNVKNIADLYVKNNLEWENIQANQSLNNLVWNIKQNIESKKWYYLTELYIKNNLEKNKEFLAIFNNNLNSKIL
jgi:GH25 family lysozyme M1 (1,4-beta-N-acetylmuramidase)